MKPPNINEMRMSWVEFFKTLISGGVILLKNTRGEENFVMGAKIYVPIDKIGISN